MLGTDVDWTGLATFVTALCGGLAALIGAVMATRLQRPVKRTEHAVHTENGDTVGALVESIHSGLPTPGGTPPAASKETP